jgi:hypothetical protein
VTPTSLEASHFFQREVNPFPKQVTRLHRAGSTWSWETSYPKIFHKEKGETRRKPRSLRMQQDQVSHKHSRLQKTQAILAVGHQTKTDSSGDTNGFRQATGDQAWPGPARDPGLVPSSLWTTGGPL